MNKMRREQVLKALDLALSSGSAEIITTGPTAEYDSKNFCQAAYYQIRKLKPQFDSISCSRPQPHDEGFIVRFTKQEETTFVIRQAPAPSPAG